jgi:hypothetical protein
VRILFFNTPECPFCINWKMPLAKLNAILPWGSRVDYINVEHDPRSRMLEKLTDYEYPALLVIKNKRQRYYNSYRVRPVVEHLISGTLDEYSNDLWINRVMRGVHDG